MNEMSKLRRTALEHVAQALKNLDMVILMEAHEEKDHYHHNDDLLQMMQDGPTIETGEHLDYIYIQSTYVEARLYVEQL